MPFFKILVSTGGEAQNLEVGELVCAVCNKTTNLRCSTCKVTFYCSVQCRDVDWASHAKECGCVQEEEWSLLRSSARRIDFDANAKGPVLSLMTESCTICDGDV